MCFESEIIAIVFNKSYRCGLVNASATKLKWWLEAQSLVIPKREVTTITCFLAIEDIWLCSAT